MGARILIIEDNATNLELLRFLLEAHGHTPICATDGGEGMQLAREADPDLIICDLHLPRFDGFEVARQLKASDDLRTIPLVAVTAFAMSSDRDRALAAGYDDYFAKPITPETFIGDLEQRLPASLRSQGIVQHTGSETSHEPLHTPGHDAQDRGGRGTILVVDDSATNRELVRLILEPEGFTLIMADGFPEAVKLAASHQIDLILSDMHMPPNTGLDLLQTLRANAGTERVPLVVFSSTSSGPLNPSEIIDQGAAGFISRPIEPQDLVSEIERVLDAARQTTSRTS